MLRIPFSANLQQSEGKSPPPIYMICIWSCHVSGRLIACHYENPSRTRLNNFKRFDNVLVRGLAQRFDDINLRVCCKLGNNGKLVMSTDPLDNIRGLKLAVNRVNQ